MDGVKEKIKKFVVDSFTFGDEEAVSYSESFLESGIIDSTGILELVEFLEKEFGIAIQDDELLPENLESIDNIAAFLSRKAA